MQQQSPGALEPIERSETAGRTIRLHQPKLRLYVAKALSAERPQQSAVVLPVGSQAKFCLFSETPRFGVHSFRCCCLLACAACCWLLRPPPPLLLLHRRSHRRSHRLPLLPLLPLVQVGNPLLIASTATLPARATGLGGHGSAPVETARIKRDRSSKQTAPLAVLPACLPAGRLEKGLYSPATLMTAAGSLLGSCSYSSWTGV
jgi:hypothetical protein